MNAIVTKVGLPQSVQTSGTTDIIDGPDGLPRVLDVALAERLGYDQPRFIRPLIKRNREALEALGGLYELSQTSGPKGGRPSTAFYLTHEQAIFITAKSDTKRAAAELVYITQVFTEHQEGGLIAKDQDTQARLDAYGADRQARLARHLEEKEARATALQFINKGRPSRKRKVGR